MDYEEEFYEFIKKKAYEIESSDISEKDKAERYMIIDGIVQKYAQIKTISLKNQLAIAILNEIQQNIDGALEEVISTTEVMLSNLEEIVKKQRANKIFCLFQVFLFQIINPKS